MERMEILVSITDCISSNSTAIFQYRKKHSKTLEDLSRNRREVSDLLRMTLSKDQFTELEGGFIALFEAHEDYWWARGVISAVQADTISKIKKIEFGLASTQQIDEAKQNAQGILSALIKGRNQETVHALQQFHALYIEDCRQNVAYAFLQGYEWGVTVLENTGLKYGKVNWEHLYQSIPMW